MWSCLPLSLPRSWNLPTKECRYCIYDELCWWCSSLKVEYWLSSTCRNGWVTPITLSSCAAELIRISWVFPSTPCNFRHKKLGGDFKYFLCSPKFGEDFQFEKYFSDGLVQPPTRTRCVCCTSHKIAGGRGQWKHRCCQCSKYHGEGSIFVTRLRGMWTWDLSVFHAGERPWVSMSFCARLGGGGFKYCFLYVCCVTFSVGEKDPIWFTWM